MVFQNSECADLLSRLGFQLRGLGADSHRNPRRQVLTSTVLWAQRSSKSDPEKNFIYLTISVPDVPASNLKLDLKPTGLTFTGRSVTLKKTYSLELEFYAEIDAENSKVNHSARDVELKLRKKELDEAYWPRLLKE